MKALNIPPATHAKYVSMNESFHKGPLNGASINLIVERLKRENKAAQFISYNLVPYARSPASPSPGTMYDCAVNSLSIAPK